jgi:hypothetical protein
MGGDISTGCPVAADCHGMHEVWGAETAKYVFTLCYVYVVLLVVSSLSFCFMYLTLSFALVCYRVIVEIQAILSECKDLIAGALDCYNTGASAQEAMESLQAALDHCDASLAPAHAYIFELLPALANCYGSLKNYSKKLIICRRALEMMETGGFPALFESKRYMYVSCGVAIAQLLQDMSKRHQHKKVGPNIVKLRKNYRAERELILQKALTVTRTCYGENHTETVAARELYESTQA